MMAAPIAEMSLAPLAHALYLFGSAPIMMIGRFCAPFSLTRSFAGQTAPRLGTIPLVILTAGIRREPTVAVDAFLAKMF